MEIHNKPSSTFAHQGDLPRWISLFWQFVFAYSSSRLPVPDLYATLQRYIRSVKPLCTDDEYVGAVEAALEMLQPGGQGEELQSRLKQRMLDKANEFAEFTSPYDGSHMTQVVAH